MNMKTLAFVAAMLIALSFPAIARADGHGGGGSSHGGGGSSHGGGGWSHGGSSWSHGDGGWSHGGGWGDGGGWDHDHGHSSSSVFGFSLGFSSGYPGYGYYGRPYYAPGYYAYAYAPRVVYRRPYYRWGYWGGRPDTGLRSGVSRSDIAQLHISSILSTAEAWGRMTGGQYDGKYALLVLADPAADRTGFRTDGAWSDAGKFMALANAMRDRVGQPRAAMPFDN